MESFARSEMLQRIRGEAMNESTDLIVRTRVVMGVEFEIFMIDGEEFISMPNFARAIGYPDPRPLTKLMKRHPDEFDNKIRVFILNTGGNQALTVINREGVIRACMLSKAPGAKEFRDKAERVIFEVMTKGYYTNSDAKNQFNPDVLTQILNQLNETVLIQGRMLNNLVAQQDRRLKEIRQPVCRISSVSWFALKKLLVFDRFVVFTSRYPG
jgi:prophage antirepressor-like protein